MALDPKDGGWQSRKLALTAFTQLLLFLGAILAGRYALMGPHYETLAGTLLACLAAFLGVNVASKWTIGKNIARIQATKGQFQDDEPEAPEPPEEPEPPPAPVPVHPKTLAELAREQDQKRS